MKFKLYTSLFILALVSVTASASSIVYVGFEDTPVFGDLDYNDITAVITGSVLHQTGGIFSTLTPSIINDSGNVFWDHVSSDGPGDNIGNIWLNDYNADNVQYLADAGGKIDTAVWFSGGSTVTITGGQTADTDKLFECALGGTACQAVNGSLTFTPTGDWELMAQVNGGAKYYSDPTWQQSSSFAFAEGTQTPEPNAGLMALAGLGFVLMSRRWRSQKQ